jgi:MtrB/PioB family decaheme-associated outer membrane protein
MQRSRARRTARGLARTLLLPALVAGGLWVGSAARAEEDVDAAEAAETADDDAEEAAETADADAKVEQVVRELTTQASEIQLGFLFNHVDGDPSAFAQYRGLEDDQFYVLSGFDIFRRAPWDGESTQYYRVRGLNLGLQSRAIDTEYGHQGLFGLSFLYDELPVYKTQTGQSFFIGVGNASLTLPPGWVAGDRADVPFPGEPTFPTAFQTSIFDNLHETHIGWDRRKLGSGFSMVLPAELEFDARYSYETKQGEKLIGSTFGTNGGNPRAVIIPERIDYRTHQIDGGLRYGGEQLQLALEYLGSAFVDDELSQIWENPYTVSGIAAVEGQRSQPPDNWFHQIVASGGYDLPYRTRVMLRTAFGWATQDDHFLPYTINPALLVPTALPRNSLDGEIFTSVVDFGIASRPLEKLRLDTGYRFERRDNDTPRDLYLYVPNDSGNQGTVDDSTARINMPYSLTRHEASFDAGYALPLRSEVGLGYEWELTDRDYQEVDELQVNTLSARLISRPLSFLNTRINYEHAWRNGSDYDTSRPLIKSHSPQFIQAELDEFAEPDSSCFLAGLTPEQCLFENHPLLRKYYLANLERDKVGTIVTLLPLEDLTLTLNLNWWNDEYDDSELGLTSAEHLSPGVDIAYMLNEWVSSYVFYNYERTLTKSAGWEYGNVQQALDPTRRWWSNEKVHTHTAGVGLNFEILRDRLAFGVDYLFANSHGAIDTFRDPDTTLPIPTPFLDLVENQHNVSVHADYRFTDHFSMRVGYLFQYLNTNDWAYDNLGPTSLTCSANACVIGTGQQSPHYTANVVSWSVVYTFW